MIQDLSGSWYIKGTGESMARVDSPVPLMQTDLGSLILILVTPKECSLRVRMLLKGVVTLVSLYNKSLKKLSGYAIGLLHE